MRFPSSLLDEIRARLPVSQVVARKVALKRAGRELKGLSPFKQERTPSFTVNDQKGFYHCFASGEHGDIFKFVMVTEGLSFPEAVERLAEEAGVPMPKASPRDAQVEDERGRLYALLEASARFFRDQLAAPVGADARRYIARRGLTAEAIERFGLGYAPNSRSALKEHLAKAGYTTAEMAASGMLISGDDIPVAYDRFRHRVMFPIGDLRGRAIAFGGRALDPDAPAKYLNSPETPLFHKGAMLFNAHRARAAAHDKSQIIVVEGYMDVIALSEAGFPQTVAPLGTALTEEQVGLLWRMAAEPVLCFDGDAAGRRAAFRAVETVLPHLKPGASISFGFLPSGYDPDDLIRKQGATAFQALLTTTRPLVDVLWERELKARAVDTPERKAAFEHRLEQLVLLIRDAKVQALYRREFKDRLWQFWRDSRQAKKAHSTGKLTISTSSSDETLLLALIAHPWLLDEFSDQIIRYDFASEAHRGMLTFILNVHSAGNEFDTSTLDRALRDSHFAPVFEHLTKESGHGRVTFARRDTDPETVRKQFSAFLEGAQLQTFEREADRLGQLLETDLTEELLQKHANLRGEIAAIEERTRAITADSTGVGSALEQYLSELLAGKHTKQRGAA
jgi:DNA primase